MLHITEVLCHGQTGQTNTHTGSGGFVHLTEDHGGFGNNARLGHFVIQVVALTGTLTNTGEHRVAVVRSGDVVNQLLNQNSFTNTGAAEQANFATLGIGANQIDDLNAGFQNFRCGLLLLIGGSRAVNGPVRFRLRGGLVVNGFTQQVEHTSQTGITYRDGNGCTGVDCLGASL